MFTVLASFGIASGATAAPAAVAHVAATATTTTGKPMPVRSVTAKAAVSGFNETTMPDINIFNQNLRVVDPVCLGMSWASAYVTNCSDTDTNGMFAFITWDGGNTFEFKANNTGLCLSNFDYHTVYPATCNGGAGELWSFPTFTDANGSVYTALRNVGTGNYLATDFTLNVYLIPTPSGEAWTWWQEL
jgi:hypothetical protein